MSKKHWQILVVNLVSLARVAVVPIMWYYRENLALVALLSLVGSLTDAIDGSLAREWKAQTSVGEIIDNASDAILLFFSFYLLTPLYVFIIYCAWSAYFFSCEMWEWFGCKKSSKRWAWQGIIWFWSAVWISIVFTIYIVIWYLPQWSWAPVFIAYLAVIIWKRERILDWRRRYTPYIYKS